MDLRLRIANSRLIEDRIRNNELDLGVVGGHGLAAGEECLVTGLDDELVLIVSPQHRWARHRTVFGRISQAIARCRSGRCRKARRGHEAGLNRPPFGCDRHRRCVHDDAVPIYRHRE